MILPAWTRRCGEKVILSPVRAWCTIPATGLPSACCAACRRIFRCWGVCLGHQIPGRPFPEPLWNNSQARSTVRGQIRRCGPSPPFCRAPGGSSRGPVSFLAPVTGIWPDELIVTAEDGRAPYPGHPAPDPPLYGIQFHRNPSDSVRQPHDAQFPGAFSGIKEGRQRARRFPHARNGDEQGARRGLSHSCTCPAHSAVRPSITASIS